MLPEEMHEATVGRMSIVWPIVTQGRVVDLDCYPTSCSGLLPKARSFGGLLPKVVRWIVT